jgi:hypothetical protein
VSGTAARIAALALAVAALACSPELDWREIRSDEGGFVAVLPGKPRLEERELSGRPGMVMHLWSASARGAVYGVGYADAASPDPSLVLSTRDALAANIAGRTVADHEIALGPARGREFRAEGAKATLIARVLVADRRLYQIALIAPREGIDSAGAETFFASFRLAGPK